MKKLSIVIAIVIIAIISNKENKLTIPNSAIRFRIIANSNNLEDQKSKAIVEKEITRFLENLVEGTDKKNVSAKLLENKENIDYELESILKKNNIKDSYSVSIGKNYFPVKNYKGVSYDAGYYNSLVVKLGKGNGLNWWCVMYPPLCLIDENASDIQYTTLVKEIIKKYNM